MAATRPAADAWRRQLTVLLLGAIFGIILVKSGVASWFRIQEMFHFAAFHMYGVIGSAILVGMVSVAMIRRLGLRTLDGEAIEIVSKPSDRGQVYGGIIFGCGWAMTGACPGPMFAQLGAIGPALLVTLASAVAGAWIYGWLRPHLPH